MQIVKFPRLSRYLVLAVAAALAMFLVAGCTAQEAAWEHMTLDGGHQLSVLHVPDATQQTLFTFLPVGLSNDRAHRAQRCRCQHLRGGQAGITQERLVCLPRPSAPFAIGRTGPIPERAEQCLCLANRPRRGWG